MRRAVVVLSVLAAIALMGLSSAALAAERVVHVKVRADSEHPGMEAFRAMDGNPGSIWHSVWRPATAVTPLPHEIVVDLGSSYKITGFTYVARPYHVGPIKDYEAYLSGADTISLPLAGNIGRPVAKGTLAAKGETVVKFAAPAKGRYFRLRALSEVSGSPSLASIGELTLHCKGVKFVGKPWSLKVDFPEAGNDVITLIESFPLLAKLLQLNNPWNLDPMALKDYLFPEGIQPFPGSGDPPAMFVNRRAVHDWRNMKWPQVAAKKPADSPGSKVWNYRAYETNYYAIRSASPFIRLHMGRPQLEWAKNMTALYPELPQSARKDLRAKMDKIVAALAPYGAKKLPAGHKNQPYLLPGGTRMTLCDYTIRDRPTPGWDHEVRMKVDFEPATPIKG